MFWVNSKFFSKTVFFPQIWWASAYFDRSILFFDQSKIFNYVRESLCLFRSIETVFRSIETRKTCFFKRSECLFQKVLFQKFSTFSLSDLAKAPPKIFCRFLPRFLQGFCPSRPVSLFCPSLCILFHDFMHCIGYFQHFSHVGVFDDSNLFWWNWSMSFCSRMLY